MFSAMEALMREAVSEVIAMFQGSVLTSAVLFCIGGILSAAKL